MTIKKKFQFFIDYLIIWIYKIIKLKAIYVTTYKRKRIYLGSRIFRLFSKDIIYKTNHAILIDPNKITNPLLKFFMKYESNDNENFIICNKKFFKISYLEKIFILEKLISFEILNILRKNNLTYHIKEEVDLKTSLMSLNTIKFKDNFKDIIYETYGSENAYRINWKRFDYFCNLIDNYPNFFKWA